MIRISQPRRAERSNVYLPTPEEIRTQTQQLRQSWTPQQRVQRAVMARCRVELMVVGQFAGPLRWMPHDT